MDQTVQSERVRFDVSPTAREHSNLGPVTLHIRSGAAIVSDYLTVEEAQMLGSALMAAALRAETDQSAGTVMGASARVVDAADRFEAALGEGRR